MGPSHMYLKTFHWQFYHLHDQLSPQRATTLTMKNHSHTITAGIFWSACSSLLKTYSSIHLDFIVYLLKESLFPVEGGKRHQQGIYLKRKIPLEDSLLQLSCNGPQACGVLINQ